MNKVKSFILRSSFSVMAVLILAMSFFVHAGKVSAEEGKKDKFIVRVGHNQSQAHPTNIGVTAFKEYVESRIGDRFAVEVYPSELLGSQNEMVQLTQTGAITFVVASNSLLETFSDDFSIFNLPYLFSSVEAYRESMDDEAVYGPIFESTRQSGLQALTWIDAGTRSFYTIDRPIMEPKDLAGLKIRVQQSPTNIKMMSLLGGSATPMGFGEVYTALQSKMLDGAENNEMALKDNGHGDICKYYSYDMHQMIPDFFLVNIHFWENLSDEDRAVFKEACKVLNTVEREAWAKSVEEAKEYAADVQGVKFLYPDVKLFQDTLLPMHKEFLESHPKLKPIYDLLQEHNRLASEKSGTAGTSETPESSENPEFSETPENSKVSEASEHSEHSKAEADKDGVSGAKTETEAGSKTGDGGETGKANESLSDTSLDTSPDTSQETRDK